MARMLFGMNRLPSGDNTLTQKIKIIEQSSLPDLEAAIELFYATLKDSDEFDAFYIQKTNYDNYVPRTGVNAVHICAIEYVTVS